MKLSRKQRAELIAKLIYEGAGDDSLASKHLYVREKEKVLQKSQPDTNRIGIYKEKYLKNGSKCYVRDKTYKDLFKYWPNANTIKPKNPTKKRIILLGESVARGYFYDPFITPCKILSGKLKGYDLKSEIIDLAITNLSAFKLVELFESCQVLEADAFIIFAGNNWKDDTLNLLTESNRKKILDALSGGNTSFKQAKKILENGLSTLSAFVFNKINEINKNRIPIIFVIPEYNLLDFKSSSKEKDLCFINADADEFYSLRQKVENFMANNSLPEDKAIGKRLIDLNPFNPIGYEVVANHYWNLKNYSKCKHYLNLAKDTAIFRPDTGTPRAYTYLKSEISQNCLKYGIKAINLEDVLCKHTLSGIPDRTLFLDYCHLSLKGINIVMDVVGNELSSIFSKKITSIKLNDTKKYYERPQNHLAHFMAALHNYHWGQKGEVLNFHCSHAIIPNSESLDIISKYLIITSQKQDVRFHFHYNTLIKSKFWEQLKRGSSILSSGKTKPNDLIIVSLLLKAFTKSHITQNTKINKLRTKEFGLASKPINLLTPYYIRDSVEKLPGFNSMIFYSESNPNSEFIFFTNKACKIEIIYRVPLPMHKEQEVLVFINNEKLIKLPCSSGWKKVFIHISQEIVSLDFNLLQIRWPIWDKKSLRFINNKRPILPTLGEINTLKIIPVN